MTGGRVAVDGHVHLYPAFDVGRWLEAAAANLAAAGRDVEAGVLLLTETADEGAFDRLGGGVPAPWTRVACPEPAAHVLTRPGALPLVVVAGHQIETAERIEVLALAGPRPCPDGTPLDDVLAALAAAGTPAILPWGVGKWLGGRGRIVAKTLAAHPGVLLGDNAGRPRGWPAPAAFDGRVVLPGTDPLPRPGAEAGVGRYGFLLDGPLDAARPAADLCARLGRLASSPPRFGRRRGPLAATADQVRLRLPG